MERLIALGKDSFHKHKFFCPGKTKVTASPAASKQEERTKIEEGNILHPDCFLSTIAGENIAAVALSLRGKIILRKEWCFRTITSFS